MAHNHPQSGYSSGKTGEQPMLGYIPVTHYVATEQLLKQQKAVHEGQSIYGIYGRSERVFDMQRAEIAFSINGSKQTFQGDFNRHLGGGIDDSDIQQHAGSNVLTALNGLEVDRRLMNAATNIQAMNLDGEQAQELLRDAVSSVLEYRGITVTEAQSRGATAGSGPEMKTATIQVGGVITLPVLSRKGIRVGSLVEAVPQTPQEATHFAQNPVKGRRFVSGKAQMMIREVTRESVISRICNSAPLFFKYYDKMVAAFGSNSLTNQRIAAMNGLHRFALFSAAQAIGYLTEIGAVTAIAGVDMNDTDNNVSGGAEATAVKAALRAALTDGTATPRNKYAEVAPILAVALGVIPHSDSTLTSFDSITRNAVNNSTNKKSYMDAAKAISRRCINPGKSEKNSDHLHGIAQIITAGDYAAWTINAQTRKKIANTASIGGKLLQHQLNQPLDLVSAIMASCSVETRNIIGGAISSGKFVNTIGGVDVLLANTGKIR